MNSLFESRKFKVLMIASALMGVPIIVVGVALITGHATYEQFVESSKWAVGSVSAVASAFMLAVGYEDGKAKGAVQPINNSGDNVQITTMKPPSGGDIGPTILTSIPPTPGVPAGLGSFAPVSRLAVLPLALLVVFVGACAGSWQSKAVDVTKLTTCALINYDPAQPLDAQLPALMKCGFQNASEIIDLISAHKVAMQKEGAKLGAGAHNPNDPSKVLP